MTRLLLYLPLFCAAAVFVNACGDSQTLSDDSAPAGAPCTEHRECASLLCIANTCRTPTSGAPTSDPDPRVADVGLDHGSGHDVTDASVSDGDTSFHDTDLEDAVVQDAVGASDTTEVDAAETGVDEPTPQPVDCSAFSTLDGVEHCSTTATSCGVVFDSGVGCAAVCAAAGLTCGGAYENIEGTCAADYDRPALTCGDTGHTSDYCVCVKNECEPRCDGRSCGPDGCGGTCGDCDADESCSPDGQCREIAGPDRGCDGYPYSAEALLAERVGFGRRASGGDPDRVYRVTTLSGSGSGSLRAALESDERYWIVFDVEGTITHRDPVRVRSHKTIDGRGRDITIEGALELRDSRNVIISDVVVTNPLEGHCTQAGDVLLLRGQGSDDPAAFTTRDIWIHHVEAFNGGDGLIDLRGASRVTISWSHLHTHKKGMLMGRNHNDEEAPGMQVTMHHNFFDRLTLRGPQFLFGRIHYFNNYQFEWYEYGAASLSGAQFLSENNVFQARPGAFCATPCPDDNPCGDNDFFVSKAALVDDWSSNGPGLVKSVGDWRVGGDEEISQRQPALVFSPSYPYTLETADANLRDRVRNDSGPRTSYCR